MIGSLIETTLHHVITLVFQNSGSLPVLLSLAGALVDISFHSLKSGVVLGNDRFLFFFRGFIALENIPLVIVGASFFVEHFLSLSPVVPLGAAGKLLCLPNLVLLGHAVEEFQTLLKKDG